MESIVFKQGDKIVKSITGTDANSNPLDWSAMQSISLSIVDYANSQVALFEIGSGLEINPDDNTDLQLTIDSSTSLAPSLYKYGMKMIFSNGIVKHSDMGDVEVQQAIPK